MTPPSPNWSVAVDTGGTFTDCIATSPSGVEHVVKVLSTGTLRGRVVSCDGRHLYVKWGDLPEGVDLAGMSVATSARSHHGTVAHSTDGGHVLVLDERVPEAFAPGSMVDLYTGEPAPILATRLATGTPGRTSLPPVALRVATTRGTNALLEREVDPVAFFVTEGLRDLLVIGDQRRRDLFALEITKPNPLIAHVEEVSGRVSATGEELSPLEIEQIAAAGRRVVSRGITVAAVALMHAGRSPEHERAVAEILKEQGVEHVVCSHAISAVPRIGPRSHATVVDACLTSPVGIFLQEVAAALHAGSVDTLSVMSSSGGLVLASEFDPHASLLSGPAGGVVGATAVGKSLNAEAIISFDMGGTSTDVAWNDGVLRRSSTITVGDIEMGADALAIETVAAGGGSICNFVNGRWSVGPQSAGADPGPACYGQGGALTLTDVNLLAGRVDPEIFAIPIDVAASRRALASVCEAATQWGSPCSEDEAVSGLLAIADQRVAETIRSSCASHGGDPASATLVAFGGAGGQHACGVAAHLGITQIIVPSDAAVLSAAGVAAATVQHRETRSLLMPLSSSAVALVEAATVMADTCIAVVASQCGDQTTSTPVVEVLIRLSGQETSFPVLTSIDDIDESVLADEFSAVFERVYGYPPPQRPLEIEAVSVTVTQAIQVVVENDVALPQRRPQPSHSTRILIDGKWTPAEAYRWRDLAEGDVLEGPSLIGDVSTTIVVEAGWTATVRGGRNVVLKTTGDRDQRVRESHVVEELFVDGLTAIATEMGEVLRRTAISVNVKERLDYSCGILDGQANLLVHAPHMPVHLGAMSPCVKAVLAELDVGPGDVVITNHPAFGGTHLPDISVVTGIFDDAGVRIGFVTSRAHHAELGGMQPGSMPSTATCLTEEGCVIRPFYIVRGGVFDRDRITAALQECPWPSRALPDNLADIEATIAANQRGVDRVRDLVGDRGGADPGAWFQEMAESITARASRLARGAIDRLTDGTFQAEGHLDDGHPLPVAVTIKGDQMHIDFSGAGPVHPWNLNATEAIVRAAVIYVLRLLIDHPIGLNEGLLDPVTLTIPPGSFLSPDFSKPGKSSPAVVGGNTEVSQRLVETMLEALGLCSGSQGTMNNLLLGDDTRTYYETICGGSGAGPHFDGTDAVHTHMTNSAMTDPEVLEHRLPVRVVSFEVRHGSGGDGRYRGGCGVVRRLQVTEPLQVSLLMQGRRRGGAGMHGGGDGAKGEQSIHRFSGHVDSLEGVDGTIAEPGDVIEIKTPGGGGWGDPSL